MYRLRFMAGLLSSLLAVAAQAQSPEGEIDSSQDRIPETAGGHSYDASLPTDWKILSVDIDGVKKDVAFYGLGTLLSKKIAIGPLNSFEFALDPTHTPKRIDYFEFKHVYRGIYEFDGELLRICLGGRNRPRPTAFATVAGDKITLVVARRREKKIRPPAPTTAATPVDSAKETAAITVRMAEFIAALETGDAQHFVKVAMAPASRERAQVEKEKPNANDPEVKERVARFLSLLKVLKNTTPTIEPDGVRAYFDLTKLPSNPLSVGSVKLKKVDGRWYLDDL